VFARAAAATLYPRELSVTSASKPKNVWASFFAALTAVLLIAVLALAIAVGGVPLAVGGRALNVHGDSMAPTFERGDIIVIRGVEDSAAIEAGQIISYRSAGPGSSVVTRRVVGEAGEGPDRRMVTRSDADETQEDNVAESQIVGVYMYRIPKLGYAVGWAGEHGLALIVICSVVVLGIGTFLIVTARRRAARAHEARHSAARAPDPRHAAASAGRDAEGVGRPRPAGPERRSARAPVPPTPGRPESEAARTGGRRPDGIGQAPVRRRAEAKQADLTDTLTGDEIPRRKAVPWIPGPTATGDEPRRTGREGLPTWDEVATTRSAGPPAGRKVTTRPDTIAKPVAFVPTGPAMEGHSTGPLPRRRPRRIAEDSSVAELIPHSRVPVYPTGEMAAIELDEPSPGPPPARSDKPIAARIPRAQTPPEPGPELRAVHIERAQPFGDGASPASPRPPRRQTREDPAPADGSPFDALRQKAAEVMHESGELRLARESSEPGRTAHRSGEPTPPDPERPWLNARRWPGAD
jgi:signal peptidase